MTVDQWDEKKVQQHIDNEIEESLELDYKDSRSLGRSEGKKREITKDISAMANSAGGLIMYGVSEYQDNDKSHLPEKISPIDQKEFSKEWLEQIISSIRPKIPDVKIHPVTVSSGFVYVVDIPQSSLGHQARDKRYYKRYNFESVAMDDYELKDILTRRTEPVFDISFDFAFYSSDLSICQIEVKLNNIGNILANYVSIYVFIPLTFLPEYVKGSASDDEILEKDNIQYYKTVITNTKNTYNYSHHGGIGNMGYTKSEIASTYFEPLLPGLTLTNTIDVEMTIHSKKANIPIVYRIFADSSKPKEGMKYLANLPEYSSQTGE